MRIPLAAVEPGDLVSVRVTDTFSIELRTPISGSATIANGGRRYLRAWQTVAQFAAVASPDDTVELLQRKSLGDGQQTRHPHGWAFTRPDLAEPMHYFEDTESLCGEIIGYGGLCYPLFEAGFFPGEVTRCAACTSAVEARSISS